MRLTSLSFSSPQPQAKPSLQRGVSLLEVLVAVVILSVGLLGLAGLQLSALRNNQSSAERSNAVMLTYSILEAMRADPDAVRSSAFDIASVQLLQ